MSYNNTMIADNFLSNLDSLMTYKGIIQKDLSVACKISQATISNWRQRKNIPNTENIQILCDYFKVPPFYFFMEPGTQDKLAACRVGVMDSFIDDLAKSILSESEYTCYIEASGVEGYLKILKDNTIQDSFINFPEWFLKINIEVHKYTEASLIDNLKKKAIGRFNSIQDNEKLKK